MKVKRKFKYLVLTLVMSMMFSLPVFASETTADVKAKSDVVQRQDGAYNSLRQTLSEVGSGKIVDGKTYSYGTKQYKLDGGGVVIWNEIVQPTGDPINEDVFESLTPGAKQDFLKDYLTVAQACANDKTMANVTDDTVTELTVELQNVSGMGSQLMATLMASTKPDFITANRIYEPFSGPIGTALGLISILIMSLLGLTMALDIAYIVIPAFQLVLDGGDGDGKKGGISGIISQAAKNAVSSRDGGNGGQGGSGNKIALAVYFKYRWLELVVLGVCLLYLVQGQIYSFVAWVLDLVSGFLGF